MIASLRWRHPDEWSFRRGANGHHRQQRRIRRRSARPSRHASTTCICPFISSAGSRPEKRAAARRLQLVSPAPQGWRQDGGRRRAVDRFAADGLTREVVSFDDFYLTGAAQDEVAASSPNNPLLQVRGNAGTHDLALGTSTLRSLVDARALSSSSSSEPLSSRGTTRRRGAVVAIGRTSRRGRQLASRPTWCF